MKQIRISSDALADLNEGYVFYERQEAGLGDYFASSLKADIEALKVKGGSDPVVFQDFHRSLARTFSYGLFYTASHNYCTHGRD